MKWVTNQVASLSPWCNRIRMVLLPGFLPRNSQPMLPQGNHHGHPRQARFHKHLSMGFYEMPQWVKALAAKSDEPFWSPKCTQCMKEKWRREPTNCPLTSTCVVLWHTYTHTHTQMCVHTEISKWSKCNKKCKYWTGIPQNCQQHGKQEQHEKLS